jgi:hypothetical protein
MKILKITIVGILTMLLFGLEESKAQSNPNNAYGDNQKEVEPGVFAIYSGDINQDGFLGFDDVDAVDQDNLAGIFGGYFVTDLTGDGFLGFDDVDLADQNNLAGIFVQRP